MFEKSQNERHATEIAKLAGARMVVTSEIAQGKQLDADKFKMLVSGDRLSARFMHQDEFEFDPVFTLWVMSNHRAKAPATEGAFWRRIKVLRYPHSVAESDRIDKLEQAIYDDEGPGVLAKLIERAGRFLDQGLSIPKEVLDETRSHRVENDSMGGWIEDEVRTGDDAFTATTDLFRSYTAWCKLHGAPALERNPFRKALIELGYAPKDMAQARGFKGIYTGRTPHQSSF
jgi:putative DNA primase/helicase